MLPKITVDEAIIKNCPELKIGLIRGKVKNSATSNALWAEIKKECEAIKGKYQLLEINKRPAISATRKLYRALGKDPGRYRVSSEAMCRRIIKGSGLYRLTTLVDLVNLVSVKSGYAISCLDADKIAGDMLTLGVGTNGEDYTGIGRGALNIEGLPVYRDAESGIATPTSDCVRTEITEGTQTVQININGFGPEMPMDEAVEWTCDLLRRYASATDLETSILTF
ncbi:MAG: phenylalanine--tRNA ligase beta subunit-related protein [Sodaliphilus sp.]|nr:phenylalanine--tRNA ligase beta subunit-related protein [Sodaliphilus sp.]